MKTYTTASGHTLTDEAIDKWCSFYDKGEFPEGEHSVGSVGRGRPSLSAKNDTVTLTVKMPTGMKLAIEARAKAEGISTSAAARGAFASWLLETTN